MTSSASARRNHHARKPAGAGAASKVAPMANGTRYGNGQPQWSRQLTITLKELWATWTAGELCKLTGLTRNAIIGKAWRLKLPRKKASGGKKKQRAMSGPRLRAPVYYVPTLPSP